MKLQNYTSFFHDGSIFEIAHHENKMILCMASAEMDEDDNHDNIALSKDDSIQGKLHIEETRKIIINGKLFQKQLKMNYDSGKIFDLLISDNSVELSIDWINYPPKPEINEFSVIKIEAKNIWWENIPDLENMH